MLVVLNVYLWMFVLLPAIVPMIFCRFWEPYRAWEVLPIFFLEMTVFSCFAEKSGSGVAPRRAGLPAQCRLTIAPPP